jgi:heat shock protein HslJ
MSKTTKACATGRPGAAGAGGRAFAAALLAAAAAVNGCAGMTAAPTRPGGFPAPSLADTHWIVSSIDGRAPPAGASLTAAFGADGRISGDSGCNRYSGPYSQQGDVVRIGELVLTRRACLDPERTRLEQRLMDVLRNVSASRRDRGRLILSGASGRLVLAAAPPGDSGLPRRVRFACDGGIELSVLFELGQARLSWPGGQDILAQQPAASGIWYMSARNSFRGKNDMVWTQGRRAPRSCRPIE